MAAAPPTKHRSAQSRTRRHVTPEHRRLDLGRVGVEFHRRAVARPDGGGDDRRGKCVADQLQRGDAGGGKARLVGGEVEVERIVGIAAK